jgi:hypothetical protein
LRNIHYQTLRVHTWCMAILPHPPSCSTNHRGSNAAVFFCYLTTRRQPTLPSKSPPSARSCFSLSNHVRFSSGTPTYNFHLTSGVGGVEVPSSTYHSSGTPTFEVQGRVVSTVFFTLRQIPITAPFPQRTWSTSGTNYFFIQHSLHLSLFYTIRGLF